MSGIKVEGVDALVRKLQKLGGMSPEIMGKSLLAGALVLEGAVKRSFQGAKHGRVYSRGQKSHTASAPGETPAIDYGALLNSISSAQEGSDAIVFTNQEHGPMLEFGTSKMAARPFMRPAADEHKDEVKTAIEATAKRLIEEAAG